MSSVSLFLSIWFAVEAFYIADQVRIRGSTDYLEELQRNKRTITYHCWPSKVQFKQLSTIYHDAYFQFQAKTILESKETEEACRGHESY